MSVRRCQRCGVTVLRLNRVYFHRANRDPEMWCNDCALPFEPWFMAELGRKTLPW